MSFDVTFRNFPAKFVQLVVAGALFLLYCLPVFSQVNLGRISGSVEDESGGVIVAPR